MLSVTVKHGGKVLLKLVDGQVIDIKVTHIQYGRAQLAFRCPREIIIAREEVADQRIHSER